MTARLNAEAKRYLADRQERVGKLMSGLDYLSPLKIMSRGYSYVTQDDHVVRQTADLKTGSAMIHLSDGTATAEITNIQPASEDQNE